MRATISGLMDFAVLGGTLHPVRLDLHTVVADVLQDLSMRRGRAEVVVGDLPKVWADDVQIRAVVQNLVANALKYAGHVDHPRIRIDALVAHGRARITVSDNGPGVPVDQREEIFELLVRGSDAVRSDVDGLGIGLATCRRILAAHQGALGVEESAEGGAEFWFELPVADASVLEV
jgi:signal transduction histidine kinase